MTEHHQHGSSKGWEDLWTAESSPPEFDLEDLSAEAARRRRRMMFVVAGEVMLTLGLIALTLAALRGYGAVPADRAAYLLLVWLTWGVAAGFAMWNRRRIWAPEAETARSYLALSEERARRRRRVALFVLGLTAAQVTILQLVDMLALPGLTVAGLYIGWAVWYGRRAQRDLEEVRRVAAQFDDNPRV